MVDAEEFLRRRLRGGRVVSMGAVATLLDAVAALERAAGRLTERPPHRLTHILGSGAVHDADRAAIAEACLRIGAVASALRAHAATPGRPRDAEGDTDA